MLYKTGKRVDSRKIDDMWLVLKGILSIEKEQTKNKHETKNEKKKLRKNENRNRK